MGGGSIRRRFNHSDAVVHIELTRMWRHPNARHFLHFEIDVRVDGIVGKDPAGFQEVAIFIQAVKGLIQRVTNGRDMLRFFRLEIIEILVHRRAGVNFVFDAVETRHQHRHKREIWISRGIREADFNPAAFRIGNPWNADRRRPIARRISQHNRRFKTRHQSLVAVGARVGKRVDCPRVFDIKIDKAASPYGATQIIFVVSYLSITAIVRPLQDIVQFFTCDWLVSSQSDITLSELSKSDVKSGKSIEKVSEYGRTIEKESECEFADTQPLVHRKVQLRFVSHYPRLVFAADESDPNSRALVLQG